MALRSSGATARVLGIAVLSLLAIGSGAGADTFYWHALRSSNWSDGVNGGGVSNWYSLPFPNGAALNVPGQTDTAAFSRGARSTTVAVRRDQTPIGKIFIAANTVRYTFNVEPLGGIVIQGTGLFSNSALPPRINIGRLGELILMNSARFHSYTAARPAHIFMDEDSNLAFQDQSQGGSAWAKNTGGSIRFHDQSSAQSMTLINEVRIQSPFSRIDFRGRSTGGKAKPWLSLDRDAEPVSQRYLQAGGQWGIRVSQRRRIPPACRHLVVTNRASLGEVLRVNVVEPVAGQPYTVLTAHKGRVGKFDQVETTNVNMPFPRVVYTPNNVVLYFNP